MILTLLASATFACASPIITDGDTIRCGSTRVRLLAIDAPEMPGHCRRGRRCAPGDPHASKRSLRAALRRRRVTVEPVTEDRYGRTVGIVRAGGVNASCHQLARGQAVYVRKYDNGRRIAKECGDGR